MTARAALTTIEIIEDEGLVENAARVGAVALERLHELKSRIRAIGDVRGRGLLLGIELVRDRAGMDAGQRAGGGRMYAALDRGLSFKTTMGNVLTLTPPLTVTEAQMLQALDILAAAIEDAQRAIREFVVIPGFMPGIHRAACSGAGGWLDTGDKPRYDNSGGFSRAVQSSGGSAWPAISGSTS